jgi:hypothetical protein
LQLRAVEACRVSLETAICDFELPTDQRGRALTRFYRGDELGGDASNWFAPTVAALTDWCGSSGFEVGRVESWQQPAPTRAMVEMHRRAG